MPTPSQRAHSGNPIFDQAIQAAIQTIPPGNRKLLAYVREHDGEAILCVANLGRSAQPVELDLARFRGRVPVEMIGRTPFPPIGELPYLLTLPACGFYWFHLATDAEMPHWHEERAAREDLPVLVLFDGWTSFFRDRVVPWRIRMAEKTRAQLEYEVLPRFVEAQRWYPDKGERIGRARLAEHYTRLFADVPQVEVPTISPDVQTNWHLYVIRADDRDGLRPMQAGGISSRGRRRAPRAGRP